MRRYLFLLVGALPVEDEGRSKYECREVRGPECLNAEEPEGSGFHLLLLSTAASGIVDGKQANGSQYGGSPSSPSLS